MRDKTEDTKQTDILLSITMTLLNTAVLLAATASIWAAQSVIENANAFTKIIHGGFVR